MTTERHRTKIVQKALRRKRVKGPEEVHKLVLNFPPKREKSNLNIWPPNEQKRTTAVKSNTRFKDVDMAEWPGKKHIQKSHLFFTYKQKYPKIPDQILSHCITTAGEDEKTIEELLESPEYSKYQTPKSNNVLPVDRSPEDLGVVSRKPICSITRHVPSGLPKSPIFLPTHESTFNHATPAAFNDIQPKNNSYRIMEPTIPNPGLRDRIQRQYRNKRNLEAELKKDCKTHADLKTQIAKLKSSLAASRGSDKIEKLKKDVAALRNDCEKLNAEYDRLSSNGTEPWHCEMCTFRNHHLLNQCETCCMPRINVRINAV